jgi:hypothetical protein
VYEAPSCGCTSVILFRHRNAPGQGTVSYEVLAMLNHNQSHSLLEQKSEIRYLAPNILYIVIRVPLTRPMTFKTLMARPGGVS